MAADQLDPMEMGVLHWARLEGKRHRTNTFFFSQVVGGLLTGGAGFLLLPQPADPSHFENLVHLGVSIGIGAVGLVLVTVVYSLTVAPIQQRNRLRDKVKELEAEVAELVAARDKRQHETQTLIKQWNDRVTLRTELEAILKRNISYAIGDRPPSPVEPEPVIGPVATGNAGMQSLFDAQEANRKNQIRYKSALNRVREWDDQANKLNRWLDHIDRLLAASAPDIGSRFVRSSDLDATAATYRAEIERHLPALADPEL